MPVVVSSATETPRPALVIVPSIFGVPPDLIEQMEELAERAFVVAIDPFRRTQPGALRYMNPPAALARSTSSSSLGV